MLAWLVAWLAVEIGINRQLAAGVETTITIKNLPSLFEVALVTVRAVTKVAFSDSDVLLTGRRRRRRKRRRALDHYKKDQGGIKVLDGHDDVVLCTVFIATHTGSQGSVSGAVTSLLHCPWLR